MNEFKGRKFELDNTMLKYLETLNRQCLMLNTMESDTKASYQLNHQRVMIIVQEHPQEEFFTSFAWWSFHSSLHNLTYPMLTEAIEKMNYYLKYYGKR
jgi:ERCC4-related helicase